MLGAIIGDIVGSRFEFSNTGQYDFELFTPASDFTDDTICTIAVADAIGKKKSYKDSLVEWCRRYPHPKGAYGTSFNRWIYNPVPYGSYGNGAAMRVSPVAWAFGDIAAVRQEAAKTALVSHDHPEGVKGAVTIAESLFLLRQGVKKECIQHLLESAYGKDYRKRMPKQGVFDETCQGCVPLSIHLFLQSTCFEDAVRRAVSYGGDTDTIGAIVGSLAEAHYPIPEWIQERALNYLPAEMLEVVKHPINNYTIS